MSSFWGKVLEPNTNIKISEEKKELRITNLALSHEIIENERTNVYLQIDTSINKIPLGSLIPNKVESIKISTVIPAQETCRIYVSGPNAVHILGYFNQPLFEQLNDSDPEGLMPENFEAPAGYPWIPANLDEEIESESDSDSENDMDKLNALLMMESDDESDSNSEMDSEEIRNRVQEISDDEESDSESDDINPVEINTNKNKKEKKPQTPVEEGVTIISEQTKSQSDKGEIAQINTHVRIRYTGVLEKTKKQFDKGLLEFKIGHGSVISGFDDAILGMGVGDSRKVRIPPNKAYGAKGAKPDIPPNASLIFDVTFLGIVGKTLSNRQKKRGKGKKHQ